MPDIETVGIVKMRKGLTALLFLSFFFCLACLVMWPNLDITMSAFFYRANDGFFWVNHPFLIGMHDFAYYGARVLGFSLAILTCLSYFQKRALFHIESKGWLFLFLALIVGPVLIANVGFKDHWGRARPREITEFGGIASFSPALIPQALMHKNGSFVSGDGAFGFFLPTFAYVVPTSQRSRRAFWVGLAGGVLLGSVRIVMGAHFLSDVLFAALFMLTSSALVFSAMYGREKTLEKWRDWLCLNCQKA